MKKTEDFSDGKGEFYNGNESDNSDNDENYNEIINSSSYLRVMPIITQNSFTNYPISTN